MGNGWGLAAGPMIGAVIKVDFDAGQIGVGMASGQFYNDEDRCPAPPSGEFWLIHKSGSMLKFHNDGSVEVTAAGEMIHTATQHTFNGPVNCNSGMGVKGGDITLTGGDITADGISQKHHKHNDPQGGQVSEPV